MSSRLGIDVRAVADTPLDSHIWDDSDFEEEEDEVETEADRAIEALETARKDKANQAKWMKWAEAQYPDPRKIANPTAAGSAIVATAAPPKKPAASLDSKETRKQISEQIRKEFLPGYSSAGGSKSTG